MQIETLREPPVTRPRRRWYHTAALGLFLVSVIPALLGVAVAIRGAGAAYALYQLQGDARGIEDAADRGDLPAVYGHTRNIGRRLDLLHANARGVGWARYLPVLGGYYDDGMRLLDGSRLVVSGGERATGALLPYASELGMDGSNNHPPGEDRLATLVRILPGITDDLDRALDDVASGLERIEGVPPAALPARFGDEDLRRRYEEMHGDLDGTREDLSVAQSMLHVLPDLLGHDEPKRYLILLQNDKELRPTGGFLSAYTYVEFDGGRFEIGETDNLEYLRPDNFALPATPEQQAVFFPDQYELMPAFDTNVYPDFEASIALFEEYYRRTDSPPVDGVIAVDTKLVEELIRWTGPLTVEGYDEPFSSDLIDVNGVPVPQVVYQLELHTERFFDDHRTRKSILGDLAEVLVDHTMEMPAKDWADGAHIALEQARQKHLLFYFHDREAQRLVEEHGMAGGLAETEGDYLQIVEGNWGLNKGNLFIQRRVDLTARLEDDGSITHTVSIHYENPARNDGWLNGVYRAVVSIYAPEGSQLLRLDGGSELRDPNDARTVFTTTTSPRPPFVVDELGKTRMSGVIAIPPEGGRHTITFVYRLPAGLSHRLRAGRDYTLLLQRQPGSPVTRYAADLFGQQHTLDLVYDEVLRVTLPASAVPDEPAPEETPKADEIVHIVQPGESLSQIAQIYGVTLSEILAVNDIPNPSVIDVGQRIVIPSRRH